MRLCQVSLRDELRFVGSLSHPCIFVSLLISESMPMWDYMGSGQRQLWLNVRIPKVSPHAWRLQAWSSPMRVQVRRKGFLRHMCNTLNSLPFCTDLCDPGQPVPRRDFQARSH